MDHASQAREAKGKLEKAKKAHADSEKMLKDVVFHLAEVEKF